MQFVRQQAIALAALPLLALAVPTAGLSAQRGPAAPPPHVTFVGDSVSAAIEYTSAAHARLSRGLVLRLDLKVCRRLVQTGCSYQGATPPTTALQAVDSYGRSLGDVLIVDVGYNEGSQGYSTRIDEIMRAALRHGVHGVVWVTLRASSASSYESIYRSTNTEIKAAARRWPELVVADWNAYGFGKPWFGSDGLHLTSTGAIALAGFLRPYVFRAA
ncbi:MAG TPA: hypothetical protein VLK36_15705 [Gaiellaceae bacterium]|nr:hypothetical protein [Gaiellaceae bacterium]